MAKFSCRENNVFWAKNYCEFHFIFPTDMNLDFTSSTSQQVPAKKNLGYTLQNIRKTLKV